MSADVSRVCDVVYGEERSWSRVNRTVLKIYGAKPIYQFDKWVQTDMIWFGAIN